MGLITGYNKAKRLERRAAVLEQEAIAKARDGKRLAAQARLAQAERLQDKADKRRAKGKR